MAFTGQVLDNPISGERFVFHQTASDTGGQLLAFDLVLTPDGHVPGGHAARSGAPLPAAVGCRGPWTGAPRGRQDREHSPRADPPGRNLAQPAAGSPGRNPAQVTTRWWAGGQATGRRPTTAHRRNPTPWSSTAVKVPQAERNIPYQSTQPPRNGERAQTPPPRYGGGDAGPAGG